MQDERWPFHVAKSLVERIDAWRARNPSFRSRGDAARELLKRALDGEEVAAGRKAEGRSGGADSSC